MPIRLRRASVGLLLGLFVLTLTLASVMAVDCEFVLGFKALRDIIGHEIVGECLENEALQRQWRQHAEDDRRSLGLAQGRQPHCLHRRPPHLGQRPHWIAEAPER